MHEPVGALSDQDLVALWAATMTELRRRELVRSSNNPVADIAESLAAKMLGLTLEGQSTAGYDAVDDSGVRYQIKARRLTAHNTSRQLSFLRNLDSQPFDVLLALIFDDGLQLQEMWKIPHSVIHKYARWSAHANAHILTVRGPLLLDPAVERIPVDPPPVPD
jgi:hypothetical protein